MDDTKFHGRTNMNQSAGYYTRQKWFVIKVWVDLFYAVYPGTVMVGACDFEYKNRKVFLYVRFWGDVFILDSMQHNISHRRECSCVGKYRVLFQ